MNIKNLAVKFVSIITIVCVLLIMYLMFNMSSVSAEESIAFASDNLSDKGEIDITYSNEGIFDDIYYIPNSNYFVRNPLHHTNKSGEIEDLNESGVCTTVAIQMLMGYHNYYSDRRIIPQFVDGERMLSEQYGDLSFHPLIKKGTADNQGCDAIGTSDEFFMKLFDLTTWPEFPGLGQNIFAVNNAANEFINKYSTSPKGSINISGGLINTDEVINELQKGNPVVLVVFPLDSSITAKWHVIPAYGYALYDSELGFIVHYGWGDDRVKVWMPASWFGYQVVMNVDHEHTFTDAGTYNNIYRKLYCEECGYATLDGLYEVQDGVLKNVKYPLEGDIIIPHAIEGQTITKIGDSAFSNQREITSVILPGNVTNIGNMAFYNCTKLEEITTTDFGVSHMWNVKSYGDRAFYGCSQLQCIEIPRDMDYIGEQAFYGCINMDIYMDNYNTHFSASDNVLYNKDKSRLIFAGSIGAEFRLPASVIEIADYAFSGNYNLYTLYWNNVAVDVGTMAFDRCNNLNNVYLYNYSDVTLSSGSFPANEFNLYTPYEKQSYYRDKFAEYTENISSVAINIIYISNGDTIMTQSCYYGEIIEDILDISRQGYDFLGWYNNSSFTGAEYVDGMLIDSEEPIYLYAKWQAKLYDITLDLCGGDYSDELQYNAEYGSEFNLTSAAMPVREGYIFDGWYDSVTGGVQYLTATGQATKLWDKDKDTVLYARWIAKSYEIRINNDGTVTWLSEYGLSDQQCTIEFGTVLSAINLIYEFKNSAQGYRDGMIFDHFEYDGNVMNWTSVPDLGEDGMIVEIIPIWIKERHTIHFTTYYDMVVSDITAEYGDSIRLPQLNRGGYNFLGWSLLDSDGKVNWLTMPDLTPNEQNNGTITLYANYSMITYTITYMLDGGTNSTANPATYTINTTKTLSPATKRGYKFVGWYTNNTLTTPITEIRSTTGNKTLYAKWEAKQYLITLDQQGGSGGTTSTTVMYGRPIPNNLIEPTRLYYYFEGYYDSNGKCYLDEDMNSVQDWDVDISVTLYAKWEASELNVHLSHQTDTNNDLYYEKISIVGNETKKYTAPTYEGYTFKRWYALGVEGQRRKEKEISTSATLDVSQTTFEGVRGYILVWLIAEYTEDACVTNGTLITLANGEQVPVEQLTGGEELLVWNMMTGKFDSAPILFIDNDPMKNYEVINLTFSDSTQVKVISEHAFWDIDLNKYVYLRRDADKYIGHWFNKQTVDSQGDMIWTAVKLIDVDIIQEVTTAWSPVTYSHLCYYVNGMLSMPGATESLVNIFDVDPVTMMIDVEKMQADIEQYGLFTYEEFTNIIDVPKEIFDAFNAQYFKVAIGKGILDYDTLIELVERYLEFF